MKFKGIINLKDPRQKHRLLAQLGALSEPHEFEIKPYRPRRSNRANRFYFGAVVAALVQFMEEQNEVWTPEQAHDLIVRNVLGERRAVVKATGEDMGTVRKETHVLNREEFSEFVEKAIAWLAGYGIEIPLSQEESEQWHGTLHQK